MVWNRILLLAGILMLSSDPARSVVAVQTWQQAWTGTGPSTLTPVAARELADGSNMIVVGTGVTGVVAVRYDHEGSLLSSASFAPPYFSLYTFPPPNGSQASVVTIDPFGGVFVASVSDFSRSSNLKGDIWLMKYDGLTGRVLWPAPLIFDGPTHPQDLPFRLLVDSKGDLVLVGISHSFIIVAFKCDGISGTLLWGPMTIPAGRPSAAELDSAGNVYVAANTYLYKLDGQAGGTLWGPVIGTVGITALAAGADGNLVIAGSVSHDIEVVKYNGVTGALLWGPSVFAESSSPSPQATGVDVTPSGDIVVSGTSGHQFVTLKYAGGNGVLLWGPQRSSTNANLTGQTVRIAGNGDIVASGWDQDLHLSSWRYRGVNGSVVWGPQTDSDSAFDLFHRPVTLICSSGRILTSVLDINGTVSTLSTSERDSETGGIVWSSSFTAAADRPSTVTDVTQGPDGSVFVTGYTASSPQRFVTFKYARSSGAVLWGPVFYDNTVVPFGYPFTVRTDASGDVFVLGLTDSLVLLKYSGTTGAPLWEPALVPHFQPAGLAIDSAGNVFALAQSYNGTDYDFATFKFSGATGAILWGPATFNRGPGRNDWPSAIAVTPGGDVVVSGTSMTSFPPAEWITLKYSGATGGVLWGPVVFGQSGADGDSVRDLAVDASGNLFIVGKGFNGSDDDMVTLKYDGATGAVLWGPKFVAGTGNYYDAASAAAVDANGDVVVGGYVYSDHTPPSNAYDYDFATIKYRGSDGAVLWGPQVFNGAASDADLGWALALDSAGNPVIAGTSRNGAHNRDIAILKYDGGTGAPLWGPVMAGGFGEEDLPLHNLVVRGKSAVIAGTSSARFFTANYDEVFGVQTLSEEVPPAYCGHPFAMTLATGNATGTVTWTIVSGTLPPGLFLNASTGQISGTASAIGSFAFRVRAQDSVSLAERDFVISVSEGSAFVPIMASPGAVCLGQSTTLSVPGSWTSYHWLPDGQTSSTISVSPAETTDYGVLLTDATGCLTQGFGRVLVAPHSVTIQAPACVSIEGTGYAAGVPDAGPGATYTWIIDNGTITSGAGTHAITFSAGTNSTVALSVTIVDSTGCSATAGMNLGICQTSFYTLSPCRLADTRDSPGPSGGPVLSAGAVRTFPVAGVCQVPSTAKAVAVNLAIFTPSADGDLRVFPAGGPAPLASSINFRPGIVRANNAIIPLGASGQISVQCDMPSGATHFFFDVYGFFQ